MINNKEILYIKQGNRETIIHTIKGIIHIDCTLIKLFDKWCLEELTTYKGRMEAIRKKYRLKKLVPIYINKNLMFFPTETKKSLDNIYINVVNVLGIERNKDTEHTTVTFQNGDILLIKKDYKITKKYYQRCLDIYHLI